MSPIETTISGLPGLLRRFRTQDFMGRGARELLRDWSEEIRDEARGNARIFTGDMKNSILAEIDGGHFPKWARVYSDNPKVRWMEYGTGELSEDPKSSHTAYFPPPENLRDWSSSKGLDPNAVAAGIFARGGTPPTHFFSDAMTKAVDNLRPRIERFGATIEFDAGRNP